MMEAVRSDFGFATHTQRLVQEDRGGGAAAATIRMGPRSVQRVAEMDGDEHTQVLDTINGC